MKTSKADYFGGMNDATKNRKTLTTSSVFGVISSILTGGKQANITATADTEYREVDVAMPYGFASFGFKGMKAHILSTGRKNTVVGCIDPKRPKTKKGEVIIYTEDGTQVKLDNKGGIIIKTEKKITVDVKDIEIKAGDNITVDAKNMTINADSATISAKSITLDGDVSISGSLSVGKSVSSNGYSAPGGVWHKHS